MGLYGSAPESPDPKETASAQTATNIGTAVANNVMGNVNQVTPDGTLKYTYTTQKWTDPLSGKVYDLQVPTATQTLSPEQQAIKNQTDGAELNMATLANTQSGKLNDLLGKPMDISKAPAAGDPTKISLPQYQQFQSGPNLQTSLGNAGDITKSYDVDFDTTKYEQALMDRLNPQLERDRAALETRLVNQGLQPGSEAYNRAIDEASRQSNDARISAVLNAGQEQSRLAGLARDQATFQNSAQQQQFGQNLASAGFSNDANQQMFQNANTTTAGNNALKDQTFNAQQAKLNMQNQARAQYLNEQYAQRNQPINEIIGLMSGAQVNNPQFVPTQSNPMPTVDYAGLVQQDYANKMGAYQQQQANMQSLWGGALGFGGQLASLSDKRAKKDIKKVGGLYSYRYKGEGKNAPKRIGVMAQEVEKVRPDAVVKGPDGLRRVNYGALFNAGKRK
ncbi:tail fiber domain-containing protein [Sinorhizobium sp. 7-81]|uniref:tail fiber domain-containing protein n=1 Tax=Sinorhizobium sp. 8-89 TaxID=3049089 RepID=UPI0024C40B6B|nr:tail fiber domain-containing protein [Sinorhizobium sp. 8-89]MDK1493370.1 tail fiber domain-containing protein [Sinorhizobium sp. 8-89]